MIELDLPGPATVLQWVTERAESKLSDQHDNQSAENKMPGQHDIRSAQCTEALTSHLCWLGRILDSC